MPRTLEDLPYEVHTLDQEDYERPMQPTPGETKQEDQTLTVKVECDPTTTWR